VRFERDVQQALLAAENRLRLRPQTISYPAELPVVQAKDALIEVIRAHQVVVVCGETVPARRHNCRSCVSNSGAARAA